MTDFPLYVPEDDTGPAWREPWGCCFGYCDSPFSVAFREYHGLDRQAMQDEHRRTVAENVERLRSQGALMTEEEMRGWLGEIGEKIEKTGVD